MDQQMKKRVLHKDVVIVGGGPAGMVLGIMLAHVGVDVMVLESHENFDREYRGEVLQPRFLQLMERIGLRNQIENLPHAQVDSGLIMHKGNKVGQFSFQDFIPEIPYAIWTPQPILLQAYYDLIQDSPHFEMMFHAPVKELLRDNHQVTGVIVETANHERIEIHAKVTVGADGRFSTIRRLGGFELEYEDYPGDIIWFNIERSEDRKDILQFHLTDTYQYLMLPKYPNLLQVGIILKNGKWKEIQQAGIEAFKADLAELDPSFHSFLQNVKSFRSFVPLQAKTQYIRQWAQDGCLLIGDAAHYSSPVGAIGVSLAVTTAVVAAQVIDDALQKGDVSATSLGRVQQLRDQEIRSIHRRQKRMANLFFVEMPGLQKIRPYLLGFMTRLPLAPIMMRKMMTLPKEFHIHDKFRF